MKKTISILLTLALAVCLAPGAFAASLGDVDGNGDVNSADARLALRAAVGLETFSAEQTARADVDANGDVNAADARTILRAAVGLSYLSDDGTHFEDVVTPAQRLSDYIIQNGRENGYRTYNTEYTENIDGTEVSFFHLFTRSKTWPSAFAAVVSVLENGYIYECQVWFDESFSDYKVIYLIYEDGSDHSEVEAEYRLSYATLSEATAKSSTKTVSFKSDLDFTAGEKDTLRASAGQGAFAALLDLVMTLEEAGVQIDYRQDMHLYHLMDGR